VDAWKLGIVKKILKLKKIKKKKLEGNWMH